MPAPDAVSTSTAPDADGSAAVAVAQVVAGIERWRRDRPDVLVVAMDGHGASGKTTIARGVAEAVGAALIHTDDFFRHGHALPAPGTPSLADYYDWRALRSKALEPLRAGRVAVFRGRHCQEWGQVGGQIAIHPRSVVVLEGVSASAPALADLVDRSVLVDTPEAERLRRLHVRVSDEDWDAGWLSAEQTYFSARPASSFDLTVSGTALGVSAQNGECP